MSGLFTVKVKSGHSHYFDSLSADEKKKFLQTPLTIYICEGTETEIKSWFKTINIAGIPLNRQEVLTPSSEKSPTSISGGMNRSF